MASVLTALLRRDLVERADEAVGRIGEHEARVQTVRESLETKRRNLLSRRLDRSEL